MPRPPGSPRKDGKATRGRAAGVSGAFAIFAMIYLESMGSPVPGETGVIADALVRGASLRNAEQVSPTDLVAKAQSTLAA